MTTYQWGRSFPPAARKAIADLAEQLDVLRQYTARLETHLAASRSSASDLARQVTRLRARLADLTGPPAAAPLSPDGPWWQHVPMTDPAVTELLASELATVQLHRTEPPGTGLARRRELAAALAEHHQQVTGAGVRAS